MIKARTVTYFDLWPGYDGGVGIKNSEGNVSALYKMKETMLDKLKTTDITGNEEGKNPDRIIQITTNYTTDKQVRSALQLEKDISTYNIRERNCSDFAKIGVEYSIGFSIDAKENIRGKLSTTLNMLSKVTSKQITTTIIKNAGDKINKNFIKGVFGL